MNLLEFEQLLARLDELHQRCDPDEPWWIEEEPHDYPDGTRHFTHIRRSGRENGEMAVAIVSHLTPELAELLTLMRNNLPELLRRARLGLKADS